MRASRRGRRAREDSSAYSSYQGNDSLSSVLVSAHGLLFKALLLHFFLRYGDFLLLVQRLLSVHHGAAVSRHAAWEKVIARAVRLLRILHFGFAMIGKRIGVKTTDSIGVLLFFVGCRACAHEIAKAQ